eukprot:5552017-Ditylum_brightwellii.AAC.1
MVISYAKLTLIYIANFSLICNEYAPGSPVNNTGITQQEDNDGMITQRQRIITTMKMQMISVKIVFMMRNYQ